MDWSKGFRRLWLTLSGAWLALVFIAILPDAFTSPIFFFSKVMRAEAPIPVPREEIDIERMGEYFTAKYDDVVLEIDAPEIKKPSDEWNSLVDAVGGKVDRVVAAKNAQARRSKQDLHAALALGFAVPAALLCLGIVVAWVIRGFRGDAT